MNIFNNIKVNTKILLGFLIILVLMGMVGGVALFQVSRINATVINLADNLAKDQHLADQMVSKILLVRFYANKYIQKQKLEKLNRFNEEFADFEQLLAKANQKISKPERIEMLAIIKEGVQLYGKYFKQVTQLMDQRYQIINKVLDIQGPLAEEKLEQLRESAFKADDRIAAFYAAHFQRALLLMRLDVFKYLQEGEQEWLEKFEKRYQESQTAFNKLEQELQDPNRRQLAQQAQTAIELYHQSFIRLQANYVQQHQIIETQLNIIGPKIRKNASKMSNSVRIDFNQANKATQTLVTHTWLGLLMIMGLAIIIGLSLGIVIARSITHPLKIMVKMSEHLLAGQMEQLVAIQHHQRLKQMMSRRDEMGNIVCIFNALASYFQGIIEDIVQVSQELARGHLNVKFQSKYQGDFAQIKNALQTALSNQQRVIQDIVQVSQGLAQGNLRVMPQVEYQGDFRQIKEALEIALMDLRQVIEDIVQVSQEIAEGKNVTFQAEYRGDFTQSQKALEMAADKLADTMNKNTQQNWLKTGQNKLNEQISGVQNIVELTHNVVSFLTVYLKAQIGICYLINQMPNTHQNHQLEIVASYAQARRKNLLEEFQFGQGLVEQAAKELKMLLIKIETGLEDKLIPRYLLMMPFLYENKIKGVIVLGTLEILTEIQQDFLHQVMPNIGIAVNSVESQTQMQQLLQQTQIQAKELQTQRTQLQQSNEELQNQSEELQNQSEELQSQSEELHTQAEELRQSNEELEARTQELERQKSEIYNKNLTLEETQQSLEAKAQELELASRYKSEFLANISHELRTPLNSLLILSQLLIDNKPANLTEKQIEYAQTIHNAGIDLLNLINDILDLSKVEAGKIELNLEHFSINDFIESLKLKFNPVAENKGLAFHIQLADNISTSLNTDGQRLKQIINNLLANAFKFTHQGEIKLTIQRTTEQFLLTHTAQKEEPENLSKEEPENLSNSPLAQPETEKNFILISVSDTGIGIPIDKQEVIFEAFQQADGTTNRRYGGTGLGLSISRQLARLLGGDLQLQSEEGQGSTFTLYLPETHSLPMNISTFVASSSPSASSSSPSSSSPSASSSSLEAIKNFSNFIPVEKISDDRHTLKPTDKSILIIEDDQNFSNILMELAKEKQFKCLLAEDGKTGLQLAQAYKPSAILLDIGLPQIDGWTVMEQLKDDLETRHIPVYFLSAFDQSLTAQKMGAFGYLIKPLNKAQLGEVFDKIEQFLTQITKKLLVVVDNPLRQQEILELIVGKDIQMISKASVEVAFEPADTMQYDCIILDLNIEPATGYQLLERIQMEKNVFQVPIVIYAQHDLNAEEASLLQQYAKEIPIKLVHSVADLLDQATLFLHQAETKLSEKKRNLLKMVHDKTPILKDKRVLIVDDDVRNTFALTTILEDKQMEVVCAQNGDRALEQLKNHEDIAIILMDIMMPKMDGYETMRQIRKQSRYQKLPIIALTAKAMKGDKAKCIEAGANDYLSKPIDTEKLISLMRVWLYH